MYVKKPMLMHRLRMICKYIDILKLGLNQVWVKLVYLNIIPTGGISYQNSMLPFINIKNCIIDSNCITNSLTIETLSFTSCTLLSH